MQDLEGGKRQNVSVHFHLQSNCADGQHRIASFVDAAYSYYQVRPNGLQYGLEFRTLGFGT